MVTQLRGRPAGPSARLMEAQAANDRNREEWRERERRLIRMAYANAEDPATVRHLLRELWKGDEAENRREDAIYGNLLSIQEWATGFTPDDDAA